MFSNQLIFVLTNINDGNYDDESVLFLYPSVWRIPFLTLDCNGLEVNVFLDLCYKCILLRWMGELVDLQCRSDFFLPFLGFDFSLDLWNTGIHLSGSYQHILTLLVVKFEPGAWMR